MITTHRTVDHCVRQASRSPRAGSIDHRSGRRVIGGPVATYRRVERPQARPNYPVRRAGALAGIALAIIASVQAAGAAASFVEATPAFAGGAVDTASSPLAVGGSHVARDGDSLWSIAEQHRGEVPRDTYIDQLIELNGGTLVHVGQAVWLP